MAGDLHPLSQPRLPKPGRLVRGPFELPVANRRRIGKHAREIDSRAEAKRFKMVELPLVVGEETKFGHDVVQDEWLRRFVGGHQGQNQPAIMEHQRVDLEMQLVQRRAVEFEVRFANGKVRS
ncbi:MAG: hypothetical protein DME19_13295 [Verrucomicrobia bacterium]|nr:MAG: hypothetical protein DME19_13295 [Verrucomicrobiota bacterium]